MGTISDRFIQEQTRSSYKKGSDRSVAERDSSIEEGNLKSTNIADFENEAVASLVTQFKSMAASIGKEEQSSVAQIYCILKEAFQRTSSMNYSTIGIDFTLFSIVRSCSGAHGCQNSNSEGERIEIIIMDRKSPDHLGCRVGGTSFEKKQIL